MFSKYLKSKKGYWG